MYIISFHTFFSGNVNTLSSLNAMEGEFHMRNFITAKILKVESPIKYKNKKSEEGTMLKALIADETASAKCLAYDPKMFPLFQKDECIVLHDIIKKTDG